MKVPFLLMALCLFCLLPVDSHADSCQSTGCHAAISDFSHQHQPVPEGECLACHIETAAGHPVKGGKSFDLIEQGSALCEQCHDVMGDEKVVHDPVSEGDCLACHNPHGSANPFLLTVGTDQSDLCFGCHDNEPLTLQFMHGPVAAGACTLCHSPHGSMQQSLLQESHRELCLKCHQDFAVQMQAAQIVHPPVNDGPCTNCHDPHSSSSRFMLKKKMPDLCYDCHVEVGEQMASAKRKHKPIEQTGSCGNCHSTHFSQAKGLLPTDEQSLCLSCHGNDKLGTPPLQNIKKQLEGKKNLHGPLQQGECVPCHDPHGRDNAKLLTTSYPDGLYFPYREGAYDFCLQCHDKSLLRFEETTIYTNFRNGNRNLHFVHVANNRKGRTCRICHQPHASDAPSLTSKKGVPFGDWKVPTGLSKTSSGGRCAPGCHQPLQYDRDEAVHYQR